MSGTCSVCVILFVGLTVRLSSCADPITSTEEGSVRGFTQKIQNRFVDTYLGVPYATPPINDFRFKKPHRVATYMETRNATSYPPMCYQSAISHENYQSTMTRVWIGSLNMSEDCLYLNIWAPSRVAGAAGGQRSYPVMVWIHGGDFESGSASPEIFNGAILAAMNNVVVVSIQYRLGPFGFLYFDKSGGLSGNQGFMDQVLALQWISKNIGNFGGQQERVTLFGQGTGATMIRLHLSCSHSNHLFHQAILQSPELSEHTVHNDPATALRHTYNLISKIGCISVPENRMLDCMRSVDPQSLLMLPSELAAFQARTASPSRLNPIYRPMKSSMINWENFSIPHRIIAGWNDNEGSFRLVTRLGGIYRSTGFASFAGSDDRDFLATDIVHRDLQQRPISSLAFRYIIHNFNLLENDNKEKTFQGLCDIYSECRVQCPLLGLFNEITKAGRSQLHFYKFEHRTEAAPWPKWLGVMSGFEAEYIFGMPFDEKFNFYAFTPAERELSREMMRYWTNFASTGNPDHHPLEMQVNSGSSYNARRVSWPRVGGDALALVFRARNITVRQSRAPSRCTFWVMVKNITRFEANYQCGKKGPPFRPDGFGQLPQQANKASSKIVPVDFFATCFALIFTLYHGRL